jgi:hypothetical protein
MNKTYRTKNLPGFENLLVIGNLQYLDDGHGTYHLVEVEQFINSGVLVGDRELKVNPSKGSIWINIHYLDEIDDAEGKREFANDNPFGAFKYEGRFVKAPLEITYAMYEKAVSITITEKNPPDMKGLDKTLYSGAFYVTRNEAMEVIHELLNGVIDPDDLVFELKQLEEEN